MMLTETTKIHGVPLYIHEGSVTDEERERFIKRVRDEFPIEKYAEKLHHLEIGTIASFWFKDSELEIFCEHLKEWVRLEYCEECTNFAEGNCPFMGEYRERQPRFLDELLTTMHVVRIVAKTKGVTNYNEPKLKPEPEQFKPSTEDYPMPGDAVVVKNWRDEVLLNENSYGVIEGMLGVPKEEYLVCFNPSTYWRKHVSCSGGPAYYLKGSDMKLIGEKTIMTWRFKNNIWTAHNGEDVERKVRLYEVSLKER